MTVDSNIGRVLDSRFHIRARLGSGGMGAVYDGWQIEPPRAVAIKLIHPSLVTNRDVTKRFLREARLLGELDHPAIVRVYDFGQADDGTLFLVLERLYGHTVADELAAHRVLPIERAVAIAIRLCDALAAAHRRGIIHRDLKPANAMVIADHPVDLKVLDFGLAKSLVTPELSLISASNLAFGTPLYMSPEQIHGAPADPRSDLYALGCMVHEMVSGGPPFAGDTVERVLSNHVYELATPLPGDVPEPLAELIMRAIAKDPRDRPRSAEHMRWELRATLEAVSDETIRPIG